jgi:GTP cyclohydrolase-4
LDFHDVNVEMPDTTIELKRVGIVNVYIPAFSMKIGDLSAVAVAKVEAYIDLPPIYKGIHASRNYESIAEVFSDYVAKERRIEELCCLVAKDLLERHPYASRSEVRMRCLILYPEETPVTGKRSYEKSYLLGRAIATRSGDSLGIVRKSVGVEVTGITACPSAQRTILAMHGEERPGSLPGPTHIQRAYARVIIDMPANYTVNALRLIEIVRSSMSAPTYELLKREDEARVIMKAISRPMFIEDVAREIAKNLKDELSHLPDNTIVRISVRSLESIHQHDLVANLYISLKRLREIV